MATVAGYSGIGPGSGQRNAGFFVRLAYILAGIIIIGFAQHAALGRVDIPRVPPWVHVHGLLMLAWLALFVTQSRFAAAGRLARHRRNGRIGAVLVVGLVGLTCYIAVMSLALHRYPPFFTAPFFLMLSVRNAAVFAALVLTGIARHADTQTHRRLITGGSIVILDPAFGRLLPMPLIGGMAGEWIVLLIQLGFVGAIALHDRKTLQRVHPATVSLGVVLALAQVVVVLGSRSGPVIALAERIAGPTLS